MQVLVHVRAAPLGAVGADEGLRGEQLGGIGARHAFRREDHERLFAQQLPRAGLGKRERRLQNDGRVELAALDRAVDRKSTRLNSSHTVISYAVFCLKKKKRKANTTLIFYDEHKVLRPGANA